MFSTRNRASNDFFLLYMNSFFTAMLRNYRNVRLFSQKYDVKRQLFIIHYRNIGVVLYLEFNAKMFSLIILFFNPDYSHKFRIGYIF